MYIGCEYVVDRTSDQRRVCGAKGRRDGLSLWHRSVRVSYGRALHCISKLHDGCIGSRLRVLMLGVFVDELYARVFKPRPAPNPSAWQKCCTATSPHSHRSSVSSNRLQLSCFELGVRVLLYLALLPGGLGISTEAQQPLKLKRSPRDRMII